MLEQDTQELEDKLQTDEEGMLQVEVEEDNIQEVGNTGVVDSMDCNLGVGMVAERNRWGKEMRAAEWLSFAFVFALKVPLLW